MAGYQQISQGYLPSAPPLEYGQQLSYQATYAQQQMVGQPLMQQPIMGQAAMVYGGIQQSMMQPMQVPTMMTTCPQMFYPTQPVVQTIPVLSPVPPVQAVQYAGNYVWQ